MASQFDLHVIEAKDRSFFTLTRPDRADLAGGAQLAGDGSCLAGVGILSPQTSSKIRKPLRINKIPLT